MPVVINGTTGISGVDGSAGTPAVQGTDTNTGVFFPAADTIAFAEGGTEVARFDPSGNLLLGATSSGGGRFHMQGSYARLTDSTYTALLGKGSDLISGGGTSDFAIRSDAAILFGFGSTERARIDSSGNLLVGTTASANGRQMLQFDNASQSGIRIIHGSTTYNGQAIAFVRANNSTLMGSIYCDGSNTSYNTSSDYRLKENVQPMTGALERVSALKPCTYRWKETGVDGEGFIAHELQAVVPQCVTGEKDAVDADGNPVYQGIDTSFLVATLTAAIQELKAIVDAQAVEIAQLKGQA